MKVGDFCRNRRSQTFAQIELVTPGRVYVYVPATRRFVWWTRKNVAIVSGEAKT